MKNDDKKNNTPHYKDHRDRLRVRYLKSPDSFPEYELLELLLTYTIPRIDLKPLAKDLIKKYGSLPAILAL